jgi:hypothetical protein
VDVAGSNYVKIFQSPFFTYLVITYIFVFFGWKWIIGQLSKIPVEIISNKPRPIRTLREKPERTALFNYISIILTIPFVVLTMVSLVVAGFNDARITIIHWNEWGEWGIELVIFSIASVVIFINAYIQLGKLRR